MAEIEVELNKEYSGGWVFDVVCIEGDEETEHVVELTKNDYAEMTQGLITPQELVEKSFEFLLSREKKEKILPEFNLLEIGVYFPEYEEEIKGQLG